MNQQKWYVQIRDKFWFVPGCYGILSLIIVIGASIMDQQLLRPVYNNVPSMLLVENNTATSLYSALVTALLTLTTISFSSIMVVLTTYATQFTPRALQDFMKSPTTQHTLGVFTFGVLFTLVNMLLFSTEGNNQILMPMLTVLVALGCLAFFIIFIYHSTQWLQVNHLISNIRADASKVIRDAYTYSGVNSFSEWSDDFRNDEETIVHAERSGYTNMVKMPELIDWARQQEAVVECLFQVGDYVHQGEPLFRYWSKYSLSPEILRNFLLVGEERSNVQDIEFSMQKIVEIALRAISPAINDPHTAANCINRIGALLSELSYEHRNDQYFADNQNELRLFMPVKPFREYLYKSFYQLRLYGREDISVMAACMEALTMLVKTGDSSVLKEVESFSRYMEQAVDEEQLADWDREYWEERVQEKDTALHQALTKSKQIT
ncbi:DUF2254 domain-containing protein [Marinococcus sp. PL1-022]|uniref:DUF2254 domain-containing protein n=1 Tax=Marinococcus sp. PL1-022 TaxID=3095363 RepID=UPI0029C44E60|nr:DUF2254 domain-containing protein [Marinococcus sp. PL1-022]MDX6152202.1 DUF2254 domain-containing protein [Marinococcus sp. PL1-022]